MVADPCNATLVPGIFGDQDGLLARVKLSIMNPGDRGQTAGYILWCPDYHTKPDFAESFLFGKGNLFVWSSTGSFIPPTNTVAFPYGGENNPWDPTTDSAGTIRDPAANLLDTDLVQDARTISSCIRLTYTGAMTAASGQYAFIEAMPLSSLLSGGDTTGDPTPPDVDDLFQYATKSGRLGTDTLEIVSRTDDSSGTFRNSEISPVSVEDQGGSEASFLTTEGKTQQPLVYGIAWRGLASRTPSPMVLDVLKNIEWRPRPSSGLTHAKPVAINPTPMVHKATAHLDRTMPGWSTRITNSVTSGASSIAQAAFTGVGQGIGGLARGFFQGAGGSQGLLGMAASAAPLLLL